MAQSSFKGDYFQTTWVDLPVDRFVESCTDEDYCRAALDEQTRKDSKAQNTEGKPIRLQSKILAVEADPLNAGCVFVAQSGGTIRRVVLEVGVLLLAVVAVDGLN